MRLAEGAVMDCTRNRPDRPTPPAREGRFALKTNRGCDAVIASMPDDTALPAGCEILVLEDDAALRKRLVAHLRQKGAEVTEASCLAEARRLLKELPFEFALADLHLPDGEALELF